MKWISKIPKKMMIAMAGGSACVVAVICGFLFINGEKDYRQIQVYEIEGVAFIEREGVEMEAYTNMQLNSGDVLTTGDDSYVQLKLDEDKYILMEPETKISLQASGNSQDSKTSIHLEQGAIVNRIDNKLSEKSSYQVTTPNSTMAVRGTTFRVAITYDEEGTCQAELSVFGGRVQCDVKLPAGNDGQESVMVEKGTQILVWGEEESAEYTDSQSVNYEELKQKVLHFLNVAIQNGNELSVSEEELAVITEAMETLEKEEAMPDATAEPVPTEEPTPLESKAPSPTKTPVKTLAPTEEPALTATPTLIPTQAPTATPVPTQKPMPEPETEQAAQTYVDTSAGTSSQEQVVETPAPLPTKAPSATAAPSENPGASSTTSSDPGAEDTSSPEADQSSAPDLLETPSATPNPTAAPSDTPEPTAVPSSTPEPTEVPTATPTTEPAATPEPTAVPTATPEPTAAPSDDPDITTGPNDAPTPTGATQAGTGGDTSVSPTPSSTPAV